MRLGYFGLIWGTPFVVMGQYMIWGRFLYQRWLKRRTFYALTKRRALIVKRGLFDRTSSSAYFQDMALIDKRVRGGWNREHQFRRTCYGQLAMGTPSRAKTTNVRRH